MRMHGKVINLTIITRLFPEKPTETMKVESIRDLITNSLELAYGSPGHLDLLNFYVENIAQRGSAKATMTVSKSNYAFA